MIRAQACSLKNSCHTLPQLTALKLCRVVNAINLSSRTTDMLAGNMDIIVQHWKGVRVDETAQHRLNTVQIRLVLSFCTVSLH